MNKVLARRWVMLGIINLPVESRLVKELVILCEECSL